MSAGFFGGYSRPAQLINGSTILDEDRTLPQNDCGHRVKGLSEEETIAREHGKDCQGCRSGSEPKCAACGAVTSDLARLKNYCFGCNHIACPRHAFWPNRRHLPEDHGPSTGANPRKGYHRLYMRQYREKRRGLAPLENSRGRPQHLKPTHTRT